SDIELNIYDVTGNVVKTIKGTYAKGTNKVDIEWTNTKGVYYYMLKAGDNVATKKMIVIE
ncbi:MAG: T9SS type A sorting domain-containing protein, partial [Saprospiraceae bacterium]